MDKQHEFPTYPYSFFNKSFKYFLKEPKVCMCFKMYGPRKLWTKKDECLVWQLVKSLMCMLLSANFHTKTCVSFVLLSIHMSFKISHTNLSHSDLSRIKMNPTAQKHIHYGWTTLCFLCRGLKSSSSRRSKTPLLKVETLPRCSEFPDWADSANRAATSWTASWATQLMAATLITYSGDMLYPISL